MLVLTGIAMISLTGETLKAIVAAVTSQMIASEKSESQLCTLIMAAGQKLFVLAGSLPQIVVGKTRRMASMKF